MTRIDIFSDPTCPWCYIGKATFDRALEAEPEHPFVVNYRPYIVNPSVRDRVPYGTYMELKLGGRDKVVEHAKQVQAHAAQAGVEVDFEKITAVPNTLDAHRLIRWATLEGVQAAAVSRLFKGYFQRGEDISQAGVLAGVAESIGMDPALVARLLATDADRDEVLAEIQTAHEMGVRGAPCYVIGNTFVVDGVQPTTVWREIIREINEKARSLDR